MSPTIESLCDRLVREANESRAARAREVAEQRQAAETCTVAPQDKTERTLTLMRCLGWQGGTIWAVLYQLGCELSDVWDSTSDEFLKLRDRAKARRAQGLLPSKDIY